MNVIEIIAHLEEKIDSYLEEAGDTIVELLNNYKEGLSEEVLKFENELNIINDELKQAILIYDICLNEDEIGTDEFSLAYKLIHIPSADFETIVYESNFISNQNNPIFLIKRFEDIKILNKETVLYFAKALLDNWVDVNYSNDMSIYIPNCPAIQEEGIVSYLKLLIVSEGEKFHEHIESNEYFLDSRLKENIVCPVKNYSQYSDILNVLSEYNHSKDILQKYLLLYTIIENFMYRKPIATLVNDGAGFTIRRFKELYKNVQKNELDTLIKLYKDIQTENVFTAIKIEDYIKQEYQSYTTTHTNIEANFLEKIPFKTDNIKQDFPRLIYGLRNAIVHNKETEFHLNHIQLNKITDGQSFFNEFMLPVLENIIYYLLIKPSSILDYESESIELFESV